MKAQVDHSNDPFNRAVYIEKLCPILFRPDFLQMLKQLNEPVFDAFRPLNGDFFAAIFFSGVGNVGLRRT